MLFSLIAHLQLRFVTILYLLFLSFFFGGGGGGGVGGEQDKTSHMCADLLWYKHENQRTNGPVNAHLISWPSKAQNIQNLENIW